MEKWLLNGPELDELVADIADSRKGKRAKLAVVIPSFNNNLLLKKQLNMLSKQTFSDFDIIAVYGENDDFIDTPPWASILHMREKFRTGSPGAFYIGQKKALEDGYELITLADNDCLPESDNLLEKLVGAAEDIVLPTVLYRPAKNFGKGYVINHYSCINSRVFRKAGLSFLPLYFGGDDFELIERIRKSGFKVHHVDSLASHPMNKPALITSKERKYYCGRGELEALFLNGNYLRAFTFTTLYLEMGLAFLLMGKKGLGMEIFRSVWDASSMEFFKDKNEPVKETKQTVDIDKVDVVIDHETDLGNKHWLNVGENARQPTFKRIRYLLSSLLNFNHYLGKTILLSKRYDPTDLLILLLAKTAYIKFEGKYYPVHENRSIFSIIGGIFFLALSLPLIITGSFLLTIHGALNKKIRNISSRQYGL